MLLLYAPLRQHASYALVLLYPPITSTPYRPPTLHTRAHVFGVVGCAARFKKKVGSFCLRSSPSHAQQRGAKQANFQSLLLHAVRICMITRSSYSYWSSSTYYTHYCRLLYRRRQYYQPLLLLSPRSSTTPSSLLKWLRFRTITHHEISSYRSRWLWWCKRNSDGVKYQRQVRH